MEEKPNDATPPHDVDELTAEAAEFAARSKAANTLRAYRADWADFKSFCLAERKQALPAHPEVVARYVASLAATHSTSTIARRIVTISEGHRLSGFHPPTRDPSVRATWEGVKRTKGVATRPKTPALTDDIRKMVAGLPDTLMGRRDRAVLLLGYAGAMRRSELTDIDVSDVSLTDEGLVVGIPFSKTDQQGRGRLVGIPFGEYPETCPVRAVTEWIEAAGITEGPLFRAVTRHGTLQSRRLCDKSVALVVKRAAGRIGKDPAKYAGHSLRSGLAVQAAMAGVSERSIQDQTGHRSVAMLRKYVQAGSLFIDNAAARVGL